MISQLAAHLMSLSPDKNEVVVGATDHALYAVDITGGKARARSEPQPRKVRTLYTQRHGHTEWVTCVAHTAAGAVLSGVWRENCACGQQGARAAMSCTQREHQCYIAGRRRRLCRHEWPLRPCRPCVGHTVGGGCGQWRPESSRGRGREGWRAQLRCWGHTGPVTALAWADGAGSLGSGAHDGQVLLWDVGSGVQSRA